MGDSDYSTSPLKIIFEAFFDSLYLLGIVLACIMSEWKKDVLSLLRSIDFLMFFSLWVEIVAFLVVVVARFFAPEEEHMDLILCGIFIAFIYVMLDSFYFFVAKKSVAGLLILIYEWCIFFCCIFLLIYGEIRWKKK
ncbi:MAG: hypothetical protein Q6363_007885 [Candidatus Njordarchaeota archaeon]